MAAAARVALVLLLSFAVGTDALFCGLSKTCESCTANLGCFYNIGTSSCQSLAVAPFTDKANVIDIPYDCPKAPPSSFIYTDEFGRNRAFLYSAASNGENRDEVQKCLKNVSAEFKSQYTIPCDVFGQNCSAYIALNPTEQAIVLSFRGSKGSTQFYTEAFNLLTYGSRGSSLVDGNVFLYFIEAFERLWAAGIKKDLAFLKSQNPGFELWTFGHSLGGSLASLAAVASVKANIFERGEVKSVTMGQPRTGDVTFAISHDLHVPQSYRIVHGTDLITKLPFKVIPGQANAYHHRFEVWYDNDMSTGSSFVVNERGDDWSGSNTKFNLSDSSHLTYFNEDIDNYYLLKC